MWERCYTDDGGVAKFDDVLVCTVEVSVDGELQLTVGASEDDEDATVSV